MLIFAGMLIAGLVILVLAGDWLVRGAVSAALKLGVTRILASIVIVGFGTSAPEMLVAVDATMEGQTGLAVGNIVGSNIANILLVLGISATLLKVSTDSRGLLRSVLFTGLATIAWLALTPIVGLTPALGIGFILVLIGYVLSSLIFPSSKNPEDLIDDEVPEKPDGWALTAAFICAGIVGLPLGAHFTISGAMGISESLGLRSELIGLTILAVGTSLPELAAALAATLRRENDMILGNVAGSNLFNIFGAGGIIALLSWVAPVDVVEIPSVFLHFDHWIMGGSFAIFFLYVAMRRSFGWFMGLIFLASYAAYLFGLYHFYVLGLGWQDLWM